MYCTLDPLYTNVLCSVARKKKIEIGKNSDNFKKRLIISKKSDKAHNQSKPDHRMTNRKCEKFDFLVTVQTI